MMPEHLVAAATRRHVIDAAVHLATGDINAESAFTALCEAVAQHLEAYRDAKATPTPMVPFGPRKGQRLSALSFTELRDLERFVTDGLHNAEKRPFYASNLTLRAALLAELHRRTKGPFYVR